jgi:hypothetical protein
MSTNRSFTVGESTALLRAIFPRYPDLRGMKEIPENGEFLLELRSQSAPPGDQKKPSLRLMTAD